MAVWQFLCTREAASALEAVTAAELPAATGLSRLLVVHYPARVIDPQFRMEVGYGIRRVMEHLGYELAREDVQINAPGVFSTGALYRLVGFALRDKSVRLKRVDRNQWATDRMLGEA
jgi:hypothetical protein